ncbi:hypothetical protein E3U43_020914 [Larimichthys crocea]|uniref:Uncharacterized protein n=1 Tax=Larimichthys crocea TaxID=215358 RepID=A0ACD3Q7L1_LARCR|nr:hypothetical protein E3U43_020914 [Larimichthys crocea]
MFNFLTSFLTSSIYKPPAFSHEEQLCGYSFQHSDVEIDREEEEMEGKLGSKEGCAFFHCFRTDNQFFYRDSRFSPLYHHVLLFLYNILITTLKETEWTNKEGHQG